MADNDSRLDAKMERRSSKRFPIEQEVIYKTLDHKAISPESGVGKTIDMSSGGVLFETQQRLRSGKRVEIAVSWPAQLEGGCPLKFVVVGRVVRVEDERAAITIEQHEFRTRRTKEMPVGLPDSRSALPFY
jgi:hypothetical protein